MQNQTGDGGPTTRLYGHGRPATKGQCPVCGTNLFRMGDDRRAHDGLERPAPARA